MIEKYSNSIYNGCKLLTFTEKIENSLSTGMLRG